MNTNKRSLLHSLTHYICPCLRYQQQHMNAKHQAHNTTDSHQPSEQNQTQFNNLFSEIVEVKPHLVSPPQPKQQISKEDKVVDSPVVVKYKEEDSDSIDFDQIADIQQQYLKYMQRHALIAQNKPTNPTKLLPIEKYSQNKLLVIGSEAGRLLAKIRRVEIQPSVTSINLQRSAKKHGKQQKCTDPTIDKFWQKRYILFEKFDQGIKLDTQSWYSVTPQAVAQHIASKITGFDCVLDAFAGAGGDSIQLSLTNKQVISNDIDPIKINLLVNNSAVYGVDNIQTYSLDFFELQFARGQVGVVYMSPPWGGIDYYQAVSIKPQDMQPSLTDIVNKSLQISQNMAVLLPANMDVQLLAKQISCCADQLNRLNSCSILIQKIYFQDRLKFLLVLFGSKLTSINLSDQLQFIYSLLAQGRGHFTHKRVLKKLRQDIGMIKLLNLVLQCQRRSYSPKQKQALYDVLIDLVVQRDMLSWQKLQKLNQLDELDQNYRSKQTNKLSKIKAKHNQANLFKIDAQSKDNRQLRISIVNSSAIQQTVSYVSQISQSKLTNNHHSLLDSQSNNNHQLQTTINIEGTPQKQK